MLVFIRHHDRIITYLEVGGGSLDDTTEKERTFLLYLVVAEVLWPVTPRTKVSHPMETAPMI
jgi:hypothetical protein